jgi:hypothetical protein
MNVLFGLCRRCKKRRERERERVYIYTGKKRLCV